MKTKTFEKMMNGFHWVFENKKGETLSVILHDGSYGHEDGLFEIMPSWRKPTEFDAVEGFLDFEEVGKWIAELEAKELEIIVEEVVDKVKGELI